ncbi:hypothetical protein V6N13_144761 [Hibiscus sabdariffa]|uniref:Protein ABIL5 n=1 Tax=Hibiscus sabdariffa TaxID=183260 RepID=A0ABR2FLB6_9ROSI
MHIAEIFSPLKKEDDSGQGIRFDKSLQELRDLRSQLHYAADYCETTFSNSEEKETVLENTKEYICKAVVTFVDHLGNVSANLNHSISQTDSFSEAELRINCLQQVREYLIYGILALAFHLCTASLMFHQRLHSCEQFAHKLALTRVKWNPILPRHHRRYLFPPTIETMEKSNENPRVSIAASPAELINKHELDTDGVPLFFFTCADKPSLSKNPSLRSNFDESDSDSTLVPVRDGLSILSKGSNPTFHFQQGNKKHGRKALYRKALPSGDILAFFRRSRRSAA